MTQAHWLLATAVLAHVSSAGCSTAVPTAEPLLPCAPTLPTASPVEPPPVWGFADLHAHPAIETSFDQTGLVWGTVRTGNTPSATLLPAPTPCPVETHAAGSGGPLDRTAHTIIVPLVNQPAFYPHGLIATTNDQVEVSGWPNGRDVLHQQMQISSIRRAYEGGLRIMLASATDSQALGHLLGGPQFADAFQPRREEERDSAWRQLELIETIAREQSSWMAIADSPARAREIIAEGRLALVMSLEMDGLRQQDVDALVERFHVAHIIPVHLVDNDVGGTAAFSDIFNAGSALESAMFNRGTLRYISVLHTSSYSERLGWPVGIVTRDPPVLFDQRAIPFSWYDRLGYDATCWCTAPVDQSVERRLGHMNEYGIDDDIGNRFLAHVMDSGLVLDVSHMGERAVEETLVLAEARDYPVIASHGGVQLDGPGGSERGLTLDHARRIHDLDGVLGLGTSGSYTAAPLLVARGGPVTGVDVDGTVAHGCVATNDPSCGVALEPSPFADLTASLTSLTVDVVGGFGHDANYTDFVIVQLNGAPGIPGTTVRKLLSCGTTSCSAQVTMPSSVPSVASNPLSCAPATAESMSFTVGSIESVSIARVRTVMNDDAHPTCTTGGASEPSFITAFNVTVNDGDVLVARNAAAPLTEWGATRGSLPLYQRDDHVRAPNATTDIVRIAVRSTPGDHNKLVGAGTSRYGLEACARIRVRNGAGCVPLVVGEPSAAGCGAAWTSLNHRGEWPAGTRFDAFVRVPVDAQPCRVDLAILGGDGSIARWNVDEVRLDRISDPGLEFTSTYLSTLHAVFDDEAGRIALGTDLNGLQTQMPITATSPPVDGYSAWGCGVAPMSPVQVVDRTGLTGEVVALSRSGLGTYGLLADLVELTGTLEGVCPEARTSARDSLMLSAEAFIRTWEHSRIAATRGTYSEPTALPAVTTMCPVMP